MAAALTLSACSGQLLGGARTPDTDEQARILAEAISYPRQHTAAGFARAALATRLARGGAFSVLEIRELSPEQPGGTFARLVIRIHHEAHDGGWTRTEAVTACYRMDFDDHGIVGAPEEITCPEGATPTTPPPVPRWEIPDGAQDALRSVLAGLPRQPREGRVRAALERELPAPPVDPQTGLAGRPPRLDAVVRGGEVGVAVAAGQGEGADCLLGARTGGTVLVWWPPRVVVQPGELGCHAATALTEQSRHSPH